MQKRRELLKEYTVKGRIFQKKSAKKAEMQKNGCKKGRAPTVVGVFGSTQLV